MIENRALPTPRALQSPRVCYVLYHRLSSAAVLNRHEVEPVLILGSAMPEQPDAGDPRDITLLPPAHCLESAAAQSGASSLHLDEGDCSTPPDDEVDVMTTQLEAMRLDRPAAGCEIGNGDPFTLETEQMTRIFPFGDRDEPAGRAHAQWYALPPGPENLLAAAWGGKSQTKWRIRRPVLFLVVASPGAPLWPC